MKKNDFQIPSAPIVFIDLDETLVDRDTNSLWLEWRIKQRRDMKGIPELLIGLLNSSYYKKGRLTAGKMNRYFRARTLGLSSDRYSEMAESFFTEKGVHHVYSDAVGLVENLKNKCGHVVMITGQDDYLARPFFRHFNLGGLISNRRIVENRRFIGFETPNCYADGKISLAGKYAGEKGCRLSECAFFTDSISDLPLLENVKYPYAVNPDRELYAKAVESDWPVICFEK
ncbi:MAG: HAD-IB family phosphatase [Spirochaetes bacterium]|jgi:HAD superfamily hydrolase (TIGR01490 family)|nr:HAD-IB family phosphatase [Spirochaetota bacterium]